MVRHPPTRENRAAGILHGATVTTVDLGIVDRRSPGDVIVARSDAALGQLLAVLYDRGFELASRVDAAGDVTPTIDNRRVAAARLRLDAPSSAYILNPATGLRIDLLFDFPLQAATIARRATTVKVRSVVLRIASEADLLRLKKIARTHRSSPGDAEDIAFLEARRSKRR